MNTRISAVRSRAETGDNRTRNFRCATPEYTNSPVKYVLARHKVADFTRWKEVYDRDADVRREAGLNEVFVLRNASDPKEVFILATVEDPARAHAYSDTPELACKMTQAGVTDHPDIVYLE